MDELNRADYIGRDTVVEVDLDALTHNIYEFRKHLKKHVKMTGRRESGRLRAWSGGSIQNALSAGASYLAVAFVDEAVELRNAGITAPILILGYTPPHAYQTAVDYDLTCTVYLPEHLRKMEEACIKRANPCVFMLKWIPAWGRLGLAPEEVLSFARKLDHVATHRMGRNLYPLCDGRRSDKDYALSQEQKFRQVIEILPKIISCRRLCISPTAQGPLISMNTHTTWCGWESVCTVFTLRRK